jgi:hypothetical protein
MLIARSYLFALSVPLSRIFFNIQRVAVDIAKLRKRLKKSG